MRSVSVPRLRRMDQTHRRKREWEAMPFRDMEDLAAFARDLDGLVREVGPHPEGFPPKTYFSIRYEDRQYHPATAEEFVEAAHELDLASALSVTAETEWLAGDPVWASVEVTPGRPLTPATLNVSGRKVTAVEGVMAGASRLLDERVERLAEEHAKAEEARRPPNGGEVPAATPLQRFLAHPYSVQIIGGVVAGVILLVIAALIFSQG